MTGIKKVWWRYGEAYENFSLYPAPCRKNPIKNEFAIPHCQLLLLEENYIEIKVWQVKLASSEPYY